MVVPCMSESILTRWLHPSRRHAYAWLLRMRSEFLMVRSAATPRVPGRCGASPVEPRGHGTNASLDDRLIHQRVDLLPVVPAERAGRRREIDHGEFLLRIDPPVGAAGAGPRKLPDRSHHPDHAGFRAHGDAETKAVVGAGRIGIADEILDVRAQL